MAADFFILDETSYKRTNEMNEGNEFLEKWWKWISNYKHESWLLLANLLHYAIWILLKTFLFARVFSGISYFIYHSVLVKMLTFLFVRVFSGISYFIYHSVLVKMLIFLLLMMITLYNWSVLWINSFRKVIYFNFGSTYLDILICFQILHMQTWKILPILFS